MKKYEFTGLEKDGLKRIRRISDGLVGGWIESEENLSHEGSCFVYEEAQVSGKARVSGAAQVSGKARVSGAAQVWGEAQVSGEAQVWGEARVYGEARVSGAAQVSGKARVSGEAQVWGKVQVSGEAQVWGEARVYGEARVSKNSVYITGLMWPVLITDHHLTIGCQTGDFIAWNGFSDSKIETMHADALTFWRAYKSIIFDIINSRK